MNLEFLNKRADIWRGGQTRSAISETLATGFDDLDQTLCGGGWPSAAITEIFTAQEGSGALQVVMPALAELSQQQKWIAWIAPPYIPYAPALSDLGINLSRILLIHPSRHKPHMHDNSDHDNSDHDNSDYDNSDYDDGDNGTSDHSTNNSITNIDVANVDISGSSIDKRSIHEKNILWAAEQALASETCSAVLMWLPRTTGHHLRRLQLAAQKGHTLGFMFSPMPAAKNPSPAALRIMADAASNAVRQHKLSADTSSQLKASENNCSIEKRRAKTDRAPFQKTSSKQIHEQVVRVSVMKQRGGWPGANVDINLCCDTNKGFNHPDITHLRKSGFKENSRSKNGKAFNDKVKNSGVMNGEAQDTEAQDYFPLRRRRSILPISH